MLTIIPYYYLNTYCLNNNMSLKEGSTVPYVIFKTRVRNYMDEAKPDMPKEMCLASELYEWKDVSTEDLFKNKRCVLFALPGAFTPTCSTKHLPEYNMNYEKMLALGIDEIYCLAVNDAFVMKQWGISLGLELDETPYSNGFKKVKLIPDGSVEFTRKMGMECVWTSERGFGERSWRYSMVVNDKKIEKMFEESPRVNNSGPDPFEVSDCATMMKYLEDTASIFGK
jgi:peroxiredoxin